jgi:hypothetical protein
LFDGLQTFKSRLRKYGSKVFYFEQRESIEVSIFFTPGAWMSANLLLFGISVKICFFMKKYSIFCSFPIFYSEKAVVKSSLVNIISVRSE